MGVEAIALLGDIHDGAESRVLDRAVVALEEVLDHDLPVGPRRPLLAPAEAQVVESQPASADDGGQLAENARQRGAGLEIREDERAPRVDADGQEGEARAIESWLVVGARRRAQTSVEAVRPRVIRALQHLAVAGSAHDLVAPMPADIDEAAQAVLVADDHDRHIAHCRGEVVADPGDLFAAPGVLPGPPEDAIPLLRGDGGIRVPGGWERCATLDL